MPATLFWSERERERDRENKKERKIERVRERDRGQRERESERERKEREREQKSRRAREIFGESSTFFKKLCYVTSLTYLPFKDFDIKICTKTIKKYEISS